MSTLMRHGFTPSRLRQLKSQKVDWNGESYLNKVFLVRLLLNEFF